MTRKVKTEKELGEALKSKEDEIEIEGDLARKVIRIRATGKVAWVLAFGGIGLAVVSVYATIGTGGASAAVTSVSGLVAGGASIGILGGSTTTTAISIAIAAGGVAALTRLRNYKEVSRSNTNLILRRG